MIRKIPATAAGLLTSFRGFLVELERAFPYPIQNAILHQCSLVRDVSLKLDRVVLLLTPRQCPENIRNALGVLMQRVQRHIVEGRFTQESVSAVIRRYRRHLQAVPRPLEAIEVSNPEAVKRSRRLKKQ
jgi:hypothetical protein